MGIQQLVTAMDEAATQDIRMVQLWPIIKQVAAGISARSPLRAAVPVPKPPDLPTGRRTHEDVAALSAGGALTAGGSGARVANDAPHALEPALGVRSLQRHEPGHVLMGQDQQPLVANPRDHGLGDVLRFD
jgi:hypothetical protein